MERRDLKEEVEKHRSCNWLKNEPEAVCIVSREDWRDGCTDWPVGMGGGAGGCAADGERVRGGRCSSSMPVARDRASGLAESGVLPNAHDGLLVGGPNAAFEVGAAGDGAPALPPGHALDGGLHRDRTAEVVGGDAGTETPASQTPSSDKGERRGLAQAGAEGDEERGASHGLAISKGELVVPDGGQ